MDPESSDPKSKIASVLFDVTEKRRAQDSLRAKDRMLAELFRACPESISLATLDEGRFIEANEALGRMFGYSREEILGRRAVELGFWCSPLDRAKLIERLKGEGFVRNFETKMRRRNGETFDALMSMTRFEVEGEDCLLGFVTDISGRKRIEAALSESLREKDILLYELQHRIKNGLAMIASMIELEAGRAEGERMVAVLENLKDRIDSMSALYDMFSKSGLAGPVDLRDYLGALVDSLSQAYSGGDGRVRIERSIEAIAIDVKNALPWGLIVNELVTNALKHAFPPGFGGAIRVELAGTGDWIELVVSDDGIGLPEGFDPELSGGLGLDIVRMMSAQLGGVLSFDLSRGSAFVVRVPRPAGD
jgi:PAS domain S-box-containing protein